MSRKAWAWASHVGPHGRRTMDSGSPESVSNAAPARLAVTSADRNESASFAVAKVLAWACPAVAQRTL